MPITLKAIPKGRDRTPLEEIDQDVIDAIEEAYEHCKSEPGERIQAEFADQETADKFLAAARSYAYQRPDGRVVVSGNSTKKGMARFRVETYVAPPEDEEAE